MHAASLARFDPCHPPLALPPLMQALQQENAQLMARLAEMQAERQPTEEYADAMNQAIADAGKAESQRAAALAYVAQLTKPPVCDNAGRPIAEMICSCLMYQHPGLARNDHPAIHIRLEMNSIRTDLWDAHGAEFEQVRAEDIEGLPTSFTSR